MEDYKVRQTGPEVQEALDQTTRNKNDFATINSKLPEGASPENPLTDKEYVDGKVGEEKTARQNAVATEAQNRQQADQTLDGKIGANTQAIATEKNRAEDAESVLDGKIGDNTQAIATEKNRAEGAEGVLDGKIATEAQNRQQADQTLDGKIGANTQAIATEKTRAEGVEGALQTAIDIINGKIPAQATAQNQLADKAFVNSSISTATADFKGTYNSLQELEQVTANANDYAFVVATDAAGNTVYKRYKWVDGTGWTWEYDLNNSSFTAAQWAAIQSGITAALVSKLGDLPTNAELNQRISTAIASALTAYYTKTEIDTALAAINTAIGQKASQADLTAEVNRAQLAEQTLQTDKQAVITDLATIAMGSGVSHDDTYSDIRTATIANFILLTNAKVDILFTTPINAADATLNVSATGAKPIRILGQDLPAGVVKAQTYATMVYDGTSWNIVNLFCPDAQFDPAALVVDMGLPSGTKWAARDIDITKPGGFCETPFIYEKSFFSWGNIDGHNPSSVSAFDYNWGDVNGSEPYYEGQPYGTTPGNTLTGNIAVGEDFDAARANLGAPWRMPTSAEFVELFANIIYIDANGDEVDTTKTDKRVDVNGVKGLYLESTINGARLFFSCSGRGYGRAWNSRGSYGLYWSSTWNSARLARNLSFYSGGVYPQYDNSRYSGFALRPVQ